MRVLLDQEVHVDHNWVFLTPEDDDGPDLARTWAGMRVGLVGAGEPGVLSLSTSLHLGVVPIRVELHAGPPDLAAEWEEAVEVSFRTEDAPYVLTTADDRADLDLPRDVDLRVRCCASGVDAAYDGTRGPGEPVLDRYLLQLWPAAPAPDALLRVTGARARHAHDRVRASAAEPVAPTEAEIRALARARARATLDRIRAGRR